MACSEAISTWLVSFLSTMITKYNFNQINEAIEDQKQGKVVKVVFTFA
jgi:Zn-dependent alcohol dehydrogenase